MIDNVLNTLTSISICLIIILAATSIVFFRKAKDSEELKELKKSIRKKPRAKGSHKVLVVGIRDRKGKITKTLALQGHKPFSLRITLSQFIKNISMSIELFISNIIAVFGKNKKL